RKPSLYPSELQGHCRYSNLPAAPRRIWGLNGYEFLKTASARLEYENPWEGRCISKKRNRFSVGLQSSVGLTGFFTVQEISGEHENRRQASFHLSDKEKNHPGRKNVTVPSTLC